MIYFIIIIIAILVIGGLVFYKLYHNHIEFKYKYDYDNIMCEMSDLIDSYNMYKETNDYIYYTDVKSFIRLYHKFNKNN